LSVVIQLIPNQSNRRSAVQWDFPLVYSLPFLSSVLVFRRIPRVFFELVGPLNCLLKIEQGARVYASYKRPSLSRWCGQIENQSFAAVSFERGILWNALADLRTCYVFGLIFQNAWRAVDEKWDKLPDAEDSWREENDNFSKKNFFAVTLEWIAFVLMTFILLIFNTTCQFLSHLEIKLFLQWCLNECHVL
jgi:hypothetical protein